MSDEELLTLYSRAGETVVFGELYHRYIPLVYGLCLKYLEDKDAAQDAVMDIYELIAGKVANYEIANFRTWLYSVAKNHCLQMIRKEKRAIYVKIEDAVVENEDIFTLIDKTQSEEEVKALTYCMGTLSGEQQQSVNYFYIENRSYADIVDLTGFPLNKVKSYIQNGKRNLKSCLIKVLGNVES